MSLQGYINVKQGVLFLLLFLAYFRSGEITWFLKYDFNSFSLLKKGLVLLSCLILS